MLCVGTTGANSTSLSEQCAKKNNVQSTMQQNPILNEYLSNFSLKMLCTTNSQVNLSSFKKIQN